ncbi:hypothetical protein [Pseudomonas poae]|uniref:hypothetical protein n=1 Tax=Pseudomonas poae TaxID=200451 RepID=UPI0030CA7D5D
MPEIKERPILFSAPMVRAILEGRKTVTRREIKTRMRSADTSFELHQQPDGSWRPMHTFEESCMDDQGTEHPITCPYGQSGDRLWVRETHADIGCRLTYRADTDDGAHCQVKKWTPAIHMFRRHSRILLEITDVRVERLQDISEDQAKAEGVRLYTDHAELGEWWHVDGIDTYSADPRKSFELLWSSVGGDWVANPWVWVVEFKRVTP